MREGQEGEEETRPEVAGARCSRIWKEHKPRRPEPRGKDGKDQRSFAFARPFGRRADSAQPCRLSEHKRTDANACTISTSWGSLVRAQYRRSKGPAQGPFLLRKRATVGKPRPCHGVRSNQGKRSPKARQAGAGLKSALLMRARTPVAVIGGQGRCCCPCVALGARDRLDPLSMKAGVTAETRVTSGSAGPVERLWSVDVDPLTSTDGVGRTELVPAAVVGVSSA